MLKKIIIVTIGVVILTGVEVLYAQDEPQARPGRRQAVECWQRQWDDVERPRRERAGRDDEAENPDAAIRRIRREIRQIEQQLKAIKQEVNIETDAPKKRPRQKLQEIEKQEKVEEGMRGDKVDRRLQQPRRGRNLPMLQGGKWLDELTKAYRENDRQKMGQLIWRMQQHRQQWQDAKPPVGRPGRAFRPGRMDRRDWGKDIRDEETPRPGRMGRKGQGKGAWDEQDPQRERMGKRDNWDEEVPWPGRMGGWNQGRSNWDKEAPRPGRMGGRRRGRGLIDEQGLQTGRMSRRGRDIPEQDEPESTEHDQRPDIEE
jgi:hypothetical protein